MHHYTPSFLLCMIMQHACLEPPWYLHHGIQKQQLTSKVDPSDAGTHCPPMNPDVLSRSLSFNLSSKA